MFLFGAGRTQFHPCTRLVCSTRGRFCCIWTRSSTLNALVNKQSHCVFSYKGWQHAYGSRVATQAPLALACMLIKELLGIFSFFLELPAGSGSVHLDGITDPDRREPRRLFLSTSLTCSLSLQGIRSLNSASQKRKSGTWIHLQPVR